MMVNSGAEAYSYMYQGYHMRAIRVRYVICLHRYIIIMIITERERERERESYISSINTVVSFVVMRVICEYHDFTMITYIPNITQGYRRDVSIWG